MEPGVEPGVGVPTCQEAQDLAENSRLNSQKVLLGQADRQIRAATDRGCEKVQYDVEYLPGLLAFETVDELRTKTVIKGLTDTLEDLGYTVEITRIPGRQNYATIHISWETTPEAETQEV